MKKTFWLLIFALLLLSALSVWAVVYFYRSATAMSRKQNRTYKIV